MFRVQSYAPKKQYFLSSLPAQKTSTAADCDCIAGATLSDNVESQVIVLRERDPSTKTYEQFKYGTMLHEYREVTQMGTGKHSQNLKVQLPDI